MLGKLDHLPLVNSNTLWMTDDFRHTVDPAIFKPFFWENLKKVYPGKAQHIIAMLSSTLYIDRGYYIPGKQVINPLLSQPLVELALSMPTYQTFKHGYNRFHYRKSMEKHLKGKFIWRTSKGETTGDFINGVRKNFDELRSMLLNGHLTQKGYIKPDELNRALLELKSGKTDGLWPLINLFVVEKWIDSWNRNKVLP